MFRVYIIDADGVFDEEERSLTFEIPEDLISHSHINDILYAFACQQLWDANWTPTSVKWQVQFRDTRWPENSWLKLNVGEGYESSTN